MDIVFEFVTELLLELIGKGIYDASRSSRVPKPLRIFLIILILLFFTAFIGIFFLISFLLFKNDNTIGGIVLCLFGCLMLFLCIKKFRKHM